MHLFQPMHITTHQRNASCTNPTSASPMTWASCNDEAAQVDAVQAWRDHWSTALPLLHPNPRNNGWLKRNAWFEADMLPALRGSWPRCCHCMRHHLTPTFT